MKNLDFDKMGNAELLKIYKKVGKEYQRRFSSYRTEFDGLVNKFLGNVITDQERERARELVVILKDLDYKDFALDYNF